MQKLFIFLITLCLLNGRLSADYVVADQESWGRLGNQMFVVSTVLAYGWDHNLTPIFPGFDRDTSQLSYNKERVFFRLNRHPYSEGINHYYDYPYLSYKKIPAFGPGNVSLRGQFVNFKFFHHHYDKLLQVFAPSPAVEEYLNEKYHVLLSLPNTVGVHVRTYSKKNYDEGMPFVGLEFYRLAFKKYPSDAIFVIFSDRINWCMEKFLKGFPKKRFIFISGNDHVEDLYLMSKMKHQIIPNSTFSWWAAYLNQNPKKIVCCPQQYFRDPVAFPASDFYLPEWHIIKHDFTKVPYPADIQKYDQLTCDDLVDYSNPERR